MDHIASHAKTLLHVNIKNRCRCTFVVETRREKQKKPRGPTNVNVFINETLACFKVDMRLQQSHVL